jgi:cytochrome c553
MPERMLASSRCRTTPICPFLAGQSAPYTERQLQLWNRGNTAAIRSRLMEMVARQMTDEQVCAVGLYFASVRRLK